jgi:hypothetical protein
MRDHLEPFHGAMKSAASTSIVGQAGLLWTMIYTTLERLQTAIPGIRVVRHEDLAMQPVEGFRQLYAHLGLEFTSRAEHAIRDSSSSGNPVELSRRRTHTVKMDSRASLGNWKHRLSAEEAASVRRLTEGVADRYYPEESWK